MANDKSDGKSERYAGTGRFASMIGGATLWSIPGSIVGGLMSIPLFKSVSEISEVEGHNSFLKLKAVYSGKDVALQEVPKLKGRVLAAIGTVVAFGSVAYGAVSGWRKASKGKEQFEEQKEQIKTLTGEKENLAIENAMLHENTKKFTDMHHSRAAHGSHADAALHDKAQTEQAERVH